MNARSPAWSWSVRRWSELEVTTAYALLALCAEVFVVEQACAYLDLDGKDLHADALHVFAVCDHEGGARIGAYLRVVPPTVSFTEPSLGRVVTAPDARGSGLGHELVRRGIEALLQRWPGSAIRIGAQAHLERYYAAHGFVVDSEPYLEDGIPHIEMLRAAP